MKSFRIVLASILLATLGLGFSSFAVKSYDSVAFARVCYKYTPPTHTNEEGPYRKKLVAPSQFNSITNAEFTNTSNWTSVTAGTPPTGCNTGNYVCAICFTDEHRTLQQAIDFAWTEYTNATPDNFTHGTDLDTDASKEVTIYLKSTDAN